MKTMMKDAHLKYDMLSLWWKERGRPVPPKQLLPKTGLVIYLENQPVCAGFLCKTDANVAVICNLVSNPAASSKKRNLGLNTLIKHLENMAFILGFKMVTCSANLEKVLQRYESLGYTRLDDGLTMMGKSLDEGG